MHPRLNASLKWKNDYFIFEKIEKKKKNEKSGGLTTNGYFYLMIRKKRDKIVGENNKIFLVRLKIDVNLYKKIIRICLNLFREFFLFLIVKVFLKLSFSFLNNKA